MKFRGSLLITLDGIARDHRDNEPPSTEPRLPRFKPRTERPDKISGNACLHPFVSQATKVLIESPSHPQEQKATMPPFPIP